jgi:hypothetical protein
VKLAVGQFENKTVIGVDVAWSISEKAEHVRAGQNMMHVVSCLHFSMEREVAGIAQLQMATL